VEFKERYGPWALVTGGARGLGAEFAAQLAERGLSVVLVDHCLEELRAQLARLEARGAVARGMELDLAREDMLDVLEPVLGGLEIGLMVSCAAQISVGPFLDQDQELLSRLVAVNCRAPLALARQLAPRMKRRGRGGVILLSSMSAFQGAPLVAGYASSKAFNQILGESLWAELGPWGVDVLSLAPGPTDTWGYQQTRPNRASIAGRMVMTPARVVGEALASLGRRPSLVPGPVNRLSGWLMQRLLPRRSAIDLLQRNLEGLYPDLAAPAKRRG